jgi:hypothetical protein
MMWSFIWKIEFAVITDSYGKCFLVLNLPQPPIEGPVNGGLPFTGELVDLLSRKE